MNGRIVAILLAAGAGTRFGADKLMQLLPDGTPVAVASARHLKQAMAGAPDTGDALAVVRPGSGRLAQALENEGLRIVVCENAADGMGASLAAAVRCAGAADAYVVALADMPSIRPESIAKVREAVANGASFAAPVHEGRRGHPVGIAGHHAPALLALRGDEGARNLLGAQPDAVVLVPIDDPGVLFDIDTPQDLAKLGTREAPPDLH